MSSLWHLEYRRNYYYLLDLLSAIGKSTHCSLFYKALLLSAYFPLQAHL
ncbi:hypothetical protein [Escherichia sp. E2748]|nr:hypothetical protein [Escherichia sp. E2748]